MIDPDDHIRVEDLTPEHLEILAALKEAKNEARLLAEALYEKLMSLDREEALDLLRYLLAWGAKGDFVLKMVQEDIRRRDEEAAA
jgi:hypothetical protein